ncbi:MAG TPA: Uma2 family endonuclease [Pirellulales bacterium]|nr:Uma2 family endonuclease [Pirellulales bacterium]
MSTISTPITYGQDASIAKFSVARYQKMIETGVLTPDDKVELLENYVVLKMPRKPPHDGTIDLLMAAIGLRLPAGWLPRVQRAVVFSDSQPEPDFAVVRGTARSYLARHPAAGDVGLLVEVADSSLLRDQRDKARIYARGGIVCYWIVNLPDRQVEVYTQPSGSAATPDYASIRFYGAGDQLSLMLDGQPVAAVAVEDLLP